MTALPRPASDPDLNEDEGTIVLEGVVFGSIGPIDLAIGARERVALIGSNGVGKTTLLRMLAGLVLPERGHLATHPPFGYVPQAYSASLYPWLTAAQNVALALSPKLSRSMARHRLKEAFRTVSLESALLDRSPHRLSGGEQQRIALARALVGIPRTLLLDEPFSALDLPTRVLLRERLLNLVQKRASTLVLVSHDVDDLVGLADRALVLGGHPTRILEEVPIGRLSGGQAHAELLRACERPS